MGDLVLQQLLGQQQLQVLQEPPLQVLLMEQLLPELLLLEGDSYKREIQMPQLVLQASLQLQDQQERLQELALLQHLGLGPLGVR